MGVRQDHRGRVLVIACAADIAGGFHPRGLVVANRRVGRDSGFRAMELAGSVITPHFGKYRMVWVAVQQRFYGR